MTYFYTSVHRDRNDILVRGYRDGKRFSERVRFEPTFYLRANQPTGWKSLDGFDVATIQPGTMSECRKFIEAYKDVSNFRVYGNQDYVAQYISDQWCDGIDYDITNIRIQSIDIECVGPGGFPHPSLANNPINAITIHDMVDDVIYVWGLPPDQKSSYTPTDSRVQYIECETEQELLHRFLSHWRLNYPDVITGWNNKLFDIPYIVNRLKRVLGEDVVGDLSPWGQVISKTVDIGDQEVPYYEMIGIQLLDFMDLFKKFGYEYGTQESYKLDHIAWVVLGDQKLSYEGSIYDFYKNEYGRFIEYNIKDTVLVSRMENETGLISLAITTAYMALTNYQVVFGPVRTWDSLIYNAMRRRKIAIPPERQNHKAGQIRGAYVKDPIVGKHDWVISIDAASLYPHLMMQYNMSPETILDQMIPGVEVDDLLAGVVPEIPDGTCMTAIGQLFRTDRPGIIPQIIETMYDERSKIKKEMLQVKQDIENNPDAAAKLNRQVVTLNNRQMAIKIIMNSLYGAMSNEGFRYFDIRIAESITVSGQLTIKWSEQAVNDFLNKTFNTNDVDYVIAIDTDSNYFSLAKLFDMPQVRAALKGQDTIEYRAKLMDRFCVQAVEPMLDRAFSKLADQQKAYAQKIKMKRESIALSGLWTGRKHYILNVINQEGVQYAEPKLKIVGIEAVRSSTPAVFRDEIKSTLKVVMTADEMTVQQHIAETRDRLLSLPPADIAFPRSVNNMEKWASTKSVYQKGCPIAVRAALVHNHCVKTNGLENNIPVITSGDKIKFCYMKVPNPVAENVFAFSGDLSPLFGLDQYVDRETQYDKGYLEPIRKILATIGWDVEQRSTLEQWL